MQDCHGTSGIQQERDTFHYLIGLKFKDATSAVLHFVYSLVWCWNLDTFGTRS